MRVGGADGPFAVRSTGRLTIETLRHPAVRGRMNRCCGAPYFNGGFHPFGAEASLMS
jgi:hypothetical protein